MVRSTFVNGGIALLFSICSGCSREPPQDVSGAPAVVSEVQFASDDSADPAVVLRDVDADQQKVNGQSAGDDAVADGISDRLLGLLQAVDALGRNRIQDATFVRLEFFGPEDSDRARPSQAWLIGEDAESIVVMQDDLLPWVYRRRSATTIPSSRHPYSVELKSIQAGDFELVCQKLSRRGDEPPRKSAAWRTRDVPETSYRLLIAHAAWKRGLPQYCVPILSIDPKFKENFEAYRTAVLEDLAWLQFVRGCNLLTYADRREVVAHLQAAAAIAPHGPFAGLADDLATRLQTLINDKERPRTAVNEHRLPAAEQADLYVSQIRDIHCPQTSQPGAIFPYIALKDGTTNKNPLTLKLKELGLPALPALIRALDDDTPTRTVYRWKDSQRSILVWRVSDFAWHILCDIAHQEFGIRGWSRTTLGSLQSDARQFIEDTDFWNFRRGKLPDDHPVKEFTLSSLRPDIKRQVIAEAQQWYADNKDLSDDDRMYGFFSSPSSKDWIYAGKYFLVQQNRRAVLPLLEKIPQARPAVQGKLCELAAEFGDPKAIPTIQLVIETATDHSTRLRAAIALWKLGDNSGIPLAIADFRAKEHPDESWDEPVWFLMRTKSPAALEALRWVVTEASPQRASEVLTHIYAAITGDLYGGQREAAGCVEICPVLIAAMGRADTTGRDIRLFRVRVKDEAAKAFVLLKEGTDDVLPGRSAAEHSQSFHPLEPDEATRDAQIEALVTWYHANQGKLSWDAEQKKLTVTE